jgi:hypothetical protein
MRWTGYVSLIGRIKMQRIILLKPEKERAVSRPERDWKCNIKGSGA